MSSDELHTMAERLTRDLRAALPADAEHMLLLLVAAERVLGERHAAEPAPAPTLH